MLSTNIIFVSSTHVILARNRMMSEAQAREKTWRFACSWLIAKLTSSLWHTLQQYCVTCTSTTFTGINVHYLLAYRMSSVPFCLVINRLSSRPTHSMGIPLIILGFGPQKSGLYTKSNVLYLTTVESYMSQRPRTNLYSCNVFIKVFPS